ncbi:MAG: ATP-dependent DNA helicase RecG [Propionibacteriaceae bacterium]|jgi:ATP-dependent DNA helicase RecG|nr:ATP-dependent DNA helicase RecG [Propionibacteriaceae bacterium]
MDWKTKAFKELATPLDRVLGGETAKAFRGLNCETLGDLLRLLPRHLMSGTDLTDLKALISSSRGSEEYVAIMAQVESVHRRGTSPKERLEVRLSDGFGGYITATFFGQTRHITYWENILTNYERGIFAGKISWFRDAPQLAHPGFVMIGKDEFIGSEANKKMAARVGKSTFIGLYPQTSKLPTWTVAESIDIGLASIQGIEDPLPQWVRTTAQVPELTQAFAAVHQPTTQQTYDLGVKRLRFDEAFAAQVAMAYRRADLSMHTAVPRTRLSGGLVDALDARLPFTLTSEQVAICEDIAKDLERTRPMQRLLQGEVGSGKTIVALRSMLRVVDSGGQAVLLAPTEVLAQQHAYTITHLMGDLASGALLSGGAGTDLVLLTGSMTASTKGEALERIASGQAGIIIGTHALLSQGITFHDLGLVIVDEQHRFGVEQRNALTDKSSARPHVLVMTATPIPRSVAMTVFGDLDVSTLTRIPEGRAEVTTTVVDIKARPTWVERAWVRVREEVESGRQVYIVAPRIDPSDGREGASVLELAQILTQGPLKGLRVGVLHGRLPASEKTATMAKFSAQELDVLLATSMIEVGVDQPNASMMVISDAECFGISQLHQLRGRIGRGSHPGVCLLLTSAEEGSPARDRINTVASTRDGFALAQADLAQRREGDVLGMNQSGRRSSLRLLRVLEHADIIDLARTVAEKVVAEDPNLTDPGITDYVAEIEARAQADLDEST